MKYEHPSVYNEQVFFIPECENLAIFQKISESKLKQFVHI